jgi:hypothetical protein
MGGSPDPQTSGRQPTTPETGLCTQRAASPLTVGIEIFTISGFCYLATTGAPSWPKRPAVSFLNTCAIRGSVERREYDLKDLRFRVGQIAHTRVHHTLYFDRLETRLGPDGKVCTI